MTLEKSGQEPSGTLGLMVGIVLALLVLLLFIYAFVRCCQRGQCWHRTDFVFNLYHVRGLRALQLELAPPFTVSGSLSETTSSYVRFPEPAL